MNKLTKRRATGYGEQEQLKMTTMGRLMEESDRVMDLEEEQED